MRLLIIHGWMHSTNIYADLADDFRKLGYEVDLWRLPGFGGVPAKYKTNIIDKYSRDLDRHLRFVSYDFIIAHSMGARVLLGASAYKTNNCILICPTYGGLRIPKLVFKFDWALRRVLRYVQANNSKFVDNLIRLASLPTVRRWKYANADIVRAVRLSNPRVAIECLRELTFDRFQASASEKSVTVINCRHDRIVSLEVLNELCRDVGTFDVRALDTGHTPVIEDRKALLSVLFGAISDMREDIHV